MKTIKYFLLITMATISLNSCEKETIDYSNEPNPSISTYYYVAGSSDANVDIVLIHGLATNHASWFEQVDYFKTKARVMNLNLPYVGFGYEYDGSISWTMDMLVDAVYNVLSKEDFKNVIVIGHSSGYVIGKELALKYPSIVSKLINIDFTPFIWPPEGHPARQPFVEWLQGFFLPAILNGDLKQTFIEQMCPTRITNPEVRAYFEGCMELMPSRLAHNLFCQITCEEVCKPKLCNIPVLSIHTMENLQVFEFLEMNHPNIQIEIVPFPSGHFIQMEHPAWINQVMSDFIFNK
jgi:pimeloyl-ACP methyl ester carboxylesterase